MELDKENIVAVSLFDGMSCFQLALNELGIVPVKYYASEIEKYPMQVTNSYFPNTIQIGDVRNVKGSDLGFVDFLAGGSPCQSFSFAGKRKGMSTKDEIEILTLSHYLELKEQNFEFEGQSYLFWEYMRVLEELRVINPNIKFLLENVLMGEKWQKILTKAIGINPIMINSALLSAQNRKRLYWTNIASVPDGFFGDLVCSIPQPKDKGILLKDILETDVADKYFLSDKALNYISKPATGGYSDRLSFMNYEDKNKSTCITANHHKGIPYNMVTVHNTMPRSSKTGKGGTGPLSRNDGKTYCLDTGSTNAIEMVGSIKFGRTDEAKALRKESIKNGKDHTPFQAKEIIGIDYKKTGTLTTNIQKDNLVQIGNIYDNEHNSVAGRIYTDKGKSVTLSALGGGGGAKTGLYEIERNIRRLTPRECGRLQTIPSDKLEIMLNCGVSDTQLYKMLGNGWTVDVIVYILSFIKFK